MKSKWLIVLLLLMTGVVYAQELKLDGYFNTGLGVVYSSYANTDTVLKAFGVDSEQNGFRFRLNGSASDDAGIAGIKFRFQSQSRMDQSGYFSMPYIYGWMKFFDDIVYLAAGIVDDTTWQTGDWWIIDDAGEGLGLLLKVKPIEGLNVGVGAYIISQQSAGNNNILSYGGFLPNFSNIIPKVEDAKYVFSASYAMKDVFSLGASYRMKNKAGWNGTIDIDRWGYVYDGRQESSQLIGEFRFLGLVNLTAIAAVSLDRLEDFAAQGDAIISQTFAYKFEDFTLGLNAAEFMHNRKDPLGSKISYNPGLLFNLWGSYTFNSIVPRLDMVYFWGGRSRVGGNETYMWHRRGFINREIYAIGSDASRYPSVFSVRPSVRYNLVSGTFIEIGDMFNYDFGNYDGVYGDYSDLKKRSRTSNVFYIDFRMSF